MDTETKTILASAIENNTDMLWALATRIHAHPELAFQEHQACEWLTEPLAQAGFEVEKGVAGMDTAFRATWQGADSGPTVALLCEYDALPKIGHACGHNLIGPISVGAALALKSVCPRVAGPDRGAGHAGRGRRGGEGHHVRGRVCLTMWTR